MADARFSPAARVAKIEVSEILRIGAAAAARRRQGHDTIILGAGEPDFDTPDHIKAAAMRAIADGDTKYTALDGTAQLKQAIIAKLNRDNGLEYRTDEISVSTGAKQVIYNAMQASLDPRDEVIIPAPYWASYVDIVRIAGGVPVIVATQETDGFRLQPEALAAAITPRTQWLILNSPSNPTGAAYGAQDLAALAQVLLDHPHVWLLSDEIYEPIVYDDFAFTSPASLSPDLKARTLTVNGVSKAYAMTGWRIGYGAGPVDLIRAMAVVLSQSTSCPCSISQAAAAAALEGPQDLLADRAASFRRRRDLVVQALNAIPGLNCRSPEGAFYVFAACKDMLGRRSSSGSKIGSDSDFARYLLEHADVAVVPGSAFGLSPYFRISYATSEADLVEACRRIEIACSQLG